MNILSIETSCDETALSIIKASSVSKKINFKILGSKISSQVALHAQYGGVYPMMAKREHGKNIFSIFEKVLKEAKLHLPHRQGLWGRQEKSKLEAILKREPYLSNIFIKNINKIKKPKIDAIAVTVGPGLEPALWVGISFAKALSTYWNIPIVTVNHMEGHIYSIFPGNNKTFSVDTPENMFPIMSLLVSGGHTELVLIKEPMKYKKIGKTRDDAAGEAFDKVARMLGLSYPGGVEISKMANLSRKKSSDIKKENIILPRPMIYSKNYDFSFSGLKTAVLYLIRDLNSKIKNGSINKNTKEKIAQEFEEAVIETLVYKTLKAIKQYNAKTLIIGGGVSANTYLRKKMTKKIKDYNKELFGKKSKVSLYFPKKKLTGDNALMIAIAGYFQYKNNNIIKYTNTIKARGNLSL